MEVSELEVNQFNAFVFDLTEDILWSFCHGKTSRP